MYLLFVALCGLIVSLVALAITALISGNEDRKIKRMENRLQRYVYMRPAKERLRFLHRIKKRVEYKVKRRKISAPTAILMEIDRLILEEAKKTIGVPSGEI